MKKAVIYVHGRNGSADEADHYRRFFDETYDVIGFDYISEIPWEAKEEFCDYFNTIGKNYKNVLLIANSIGAYSSLISLSEKHIEKALFISPIVDMEKLILDMMKLADVTEAKLKKEQVITLPFSRILSWKYFSYAKDNRITWNVPTSILYGEKDHITSLDTITSFANKINARLTVMPDGEHWFHTREQMEFLDNWIIENI
jgi:predicted alpha/beta hydrolase family esterase